MDFLPVITNSRLSAIISFSQSIDICSVEIDQQVRSESIWFIDFDIVLWWYHISYFLHPVLCLILFVVLCIILCVTNMLLPEDQIYVFTLTGVISEDTQGSRYNRYQFSHIAAHLRYKVPRMRYGYLHYFKDTWTCQCKDYRRRLPTSVSATSEGVSWYALLFLRIEPTVSKNKLLKIQRFVVSFILMIFDAFWVFWKARKPT